MEQLSPEAVKQIRMIDHYKWSKHLCWLGGQKNRNHNEGILNAYVTVNQKSLRSMHVISASKCVTLSWFIFKCRIHSYFLTHQRHFPPRREDESKFWHVLHRKIVDVKQDTILLNQPTPSTAATTWTAIHQENESISAHSNIVKWELYELAWCQCGKYNKAL